MDDPPRRSPEELEPAGPIPLEGDPRRTGPATGDGRNISPDLGSLSGEGAGQESLSSRAASAGAVLPEAVWTGPPLPGADASPTYYDRPVLKEPVWIWAVPVYFFCGGVAGAAAVLGEAARMLGPQTMRRLSTRCRWIAAGGTSMGGFLLILDLGRPGRFLNMLRVFRPTSAMSIGSWTLAASGAASGAAAMLGGIPQRRLGKFAGKIRNGADSAATASALLGLPLASYTAVLLSDTAVPLWQAIRSTLPPLFVSSAAASSAALLKLPRPDESSAAVVRNFGMLGAAAEIVSAFGVERQADRVVRVGRPLREGIPGYLWKGSKVLSAASLVCALTERSSRSRQLASSVFGIAGGLALRFAIFHAGKHSARDPRAAFEQQRFPNASANGQRE